MVRFYQAEGKFFLHIYILQVVVKALPIQTKLVASVLLENLHMFYQIATVASATLQNTLLELCYNSL